MLVAAYGLEPNLELRMQYVDMKRVKGSNLQLVLAGVFLRVSYNCIGCDHDVKKRKVLASWACSHFHLRT